MAKRVPRIGEIFIQKGYITWEQLDEALRIQYQAAHADIAGGKGGGREKGTFLSIGEILIKKGYVTEKNLQRALAIQHGMSFVEAEKINVPAEVLKLIPKHLAYQFQVLPLVVQGMRLLIAVSNPKNAEGIAGVEKLLSGYEVLTALMTPPDLNNALNKYYGGA